MLYCARTEKCISLFLSFGANKTTKGKVVTVHIIHRYHYTIETVVVAATHKSVGLYNIK